MFTFPIPRHRNDGSTTRRRQGRRRPLVEDLEGRQLLSGIVGQHIGTGVAMTPSIQKVRDAAVSDQDVAIKHEPAVPAIVGNHIGMGVAASWRAPTNTNIGRPA
jgi:hypothetical protein